MRSDSAPLQHYGDNFVPAVPYDHREHTEAHPFCASDPRCPCHEDQESIDQVNAYVQDGLLTPQEATRTVKGEML